MDRTERLLDLVATLLDATEPLSFARLRELFPDYRGRTPSAGLRKFERDKEALEELGLPVLTLPRDDEHAPGYRIDRASYYVPNLDLRPEEWALLYATAGAALARGDFPGTRDLSYALRKLGFTREAPPVPQFADSLAFTGESARPRQALRETLDVLWAAVLHRKRVTFDYRSSQGASTHRTLDLYGIAFRRGQWIAVGHDHRRGALRTFRADRMSAVAMNSARPRSPDFLVPKAFHLDQHVQEQTWEIGLHEPETVVVELDAAIAPLGERLFPRAVASSDGTRLKLTVRHRDGLVRQVLALGPRARVVSPPALRKRAVALLRQLRSTLPPPPRGS